MPEGRPPQAGDVVRLRAVRPDAAPALRRRPPARSAPTASTPPAAPGAAASSPRRSRRSCARPHRHSVRHRPRRRDHRGGHGRVLRDVRASRPRWTSTASPSPRPARGARVRCCCRPSRSSTGYEPHEIDPSTGRGAHRVLEALKLALADRDACYGDAAGDVPLDVLLSPAYAASRRELIGDKASHEFRPGSVAGREPYLPPLVTAEDQPGVAGAGRADRVGEPGAPAATPATSTSSTGGATSCRRTPSGGWLQSSPDHPRARLLPRHPAADDLAGRGRRRRRCGPDDGRVRRSRPTLLLENGVPVSALGTPGGDQQDQWQLLYLLRTIVGGYTAAAGDRRAGAAHHVDAGLVLAAALDPGRGGRRGPPRRRGHRRAREPRPRRHPRRTAGRSAACPRSPATRRRARCRPPPTREGRRDMPSAVETTSAAGAEPLLAITDLEVRYGGHPEAASGAARRRPDRRARRAGRARRRVRLGQVHHRCRRHRAAAGTGPDHRRDDPRSGARTSPHADEKRLLRLRGRQVGLVPQDPMANLNPATRVGQQVAETLRAHGMATAQRGVAAGGRAAGRGRASRTPDARSRQYPHEFSGGMRQRVLIAIALACEPELLIADEPTSALDVTVQRQILDHLEGLRASRGTSMLLVTHDLGLAAERADRVVVMWQGRVVESGPAAQILRDPQEDYTRRLVAAAPSLASSAGRARSPAPGRASAGRPGAGAPTASTDPRGGPAHQDVQDPGPPRAPHRGRPGVVLRTRGEHDSRRRRVRVGQDHGGPDGARAGDARPPARYGSTGPRSRPRPARSGARSAGPCSRSSRTRTPR